MSGTGFSTNDGKSPGDVAAGTFVRNPSTGQTGNADGFGGVHVNN